MFSEFVFVYSSTHMVNDSLVVSMVADTCLCFALLVSRHIMDNLIKTIRVPKVGNSSIRVPASSKSLVSTPSCDSY